MRITLDKPNEVDRDLLSQDNVFNLFTTIILNMASASIDISNNKENRLYGYYEAYMELLKSIITEREERWLGQNKITPEMF